MPDGISTHHLKKKNIILKSSSKSTFLSANFSWLFQLSVAPEATNIKNINQGELTADSCYKRTLKRMDTERRKARVDVSINANGVLLDLKKKLLFCRISVVWLYAGISRVPPRVLAQTAITLVRLSLSITY